jgi:hypothetical protein
MEIVVTVLIELFGELILGAVLQVLGQALGALFGGLFRGIGNVLHNRQETGGLRGSLPVAGAFLLYGAISIALGLASLALFPASFARTLDTRVAVLVGMPMACGVMMALVGNWKRKRGRPARTLESFMHGLAFAWPFALVRFVWAH